MKIFLTFFFLLACSSIQIALCQSAHGDRVLVNVNNLSNPKFCNSFRYNAEVNNLRMWLVPAECEKYVRSYYLRGNFLADLGQMVESAQAYVKNLALQGDGLDAWVFDIDDTILFNFPYYAQHKYGAEEFDLVSYNAWLEYANATALPTIALYNDLIAANFSVIFITGRLESQRAITEKNLRTQGYNVWKRLILRAPDEESKSAKDFKSASRQRLLADGLKIWGNMGDQWSDLSGEAVAERNFKVPNPIYYVP